MPFGCDLAAISATLSGQKHSKGAQRVPPIAAPPLARTDAIMSFLLLPPLPVAVRELQRHVILRIAALASPPRELAGEEGASPPTGSGQCPPGRASGRPGGRPTLHALRHAAALLLYNAATAELPSLQELMVECGCVAVLARLTSLPEFSEAAIHTAGAGAST